MGYVNRDWRHHQESKQHGRFACCTLSHLLSWSCLFRSTAVLSATSRNMPDWQSLSVGRASLPERLQIAECFLALVQHSPCIPSIRIQSFEFSSPKQRPDE